MGVPARALYQTSQADTPILTGFRNRTDQYSFLEQLHAAHALVVALDGGSLLALRSAVGFS